MSDTTVPQHLGLILDGNRRWAKEQGLATLEGHKRGAENFKEISRMVFNKGVKYLSAYVFSAENWSRTEEEVGYLMRLLLRSADNYLDEVHENNIKLVVLGRREGLSKPVLKTLEKIETKTINNTAGTIALCFNYGGEDELADAYRSMMAKGVNPDDVTAQTIADNLYRPEIPPVDFMIRTSGEERTSGFMLYRSAYAELYFTDKYWPDFNEADLDKALAEYASRQRRFGN